MKGHDHLYPHLFLISGFAFADDAGFALELDVFCSGGGGGEVDGEVGAAADG